MPDISRSPKSFAGLTFLLLLIVFSIGPRAAGAAAPADEEQRIVIDLSLTGRGSGDRPAALLAPLPLGTRTAEVCAAADAGGALTLPTEQAHVGRVMIMRGQPVAPVWLDAAAADRLVAAGKTTARIELIARDAQGSALANQRGLLQKLSADNEAATNRGGYLIISADAYAAELQPLIDWKIACGYDVSLHLVSETGSTQAEIQDFVRNAYETWETPPLFLLLVGDVEDLPSGNMINNVSDHVYACVDGDDFLADIYVGRFVAHSPDDVALHVAKTLAVESTPDMTEVDAGQESTWFNRGLMVAGNYGSVTPVPTSRWVREELLGIGFTQVDTVFFPPLPDGCSQLYGCPIGDAIDAGVSIINYRGWSRADPPGWDSPDYTTEDIGRLNNGGRLPFVFSIVCHTGDFGIPDEDSFGEVFVKAGTVEELRGAVGFLGTAEGWSRTRWNDRIDLGLFEALCYDGIQQVGPLMAASKASLIEHFPTEVYLDEVADEHAVEFYSYIYNILGDPSLELWTAAPRRVVFPMIPRSIMYGANYVELTVTDEDLTTAVAGARVAVSQADEVVGYAVTGADGLARVSLALGSTEPLLCTITGPNLHPFQVTIPVNEESASLTCVGAIVNGYDRLAAGAPREVVVTVKNTGTADLTGATATLTGPAGVEILTGTTTFGPIAAGAEGPALSAMSLQAASEIEDGTQLRFLLTPSVGAEELRASEFWLTVGAPDFVIEALGDGDDGVFAAGEECDLIVTLANQGTLGGDGTEAHLSFIDPTADVTLIDSLATFLDIPPGTSKDNQADPFRVSLGADLPTGTVIPLSVSYTTDDGPSGTLTGNLIVGLVDHSAPLGPDSYGYYCYDSADIDYPDQVPIYRWVEISPLYGGRGQSLGILLDDRNNPVIALPFTFTYYGASYDSVRVSDNGWLAFDTSSWYDTRNWAMPDYWGGTCQVAAFWDNLNPMLAGTDGVYSWFDEENHRFVVEWNRLMNREEEANHWQSFQILLYDPEYHPTLTGDGEIVFQYKHIVNDDYGTMYSTVGIEDQTEEIGIQYTYCNFYAQEASPLAPGLAICFTTEAPQLGPVTYGDLAGGVQLRLLSANPTSGPATILFGAGSAGAREGAELAIYDANGRHLRTLRDAPGGVVTWDGRDATGRRLASGLYWVHMISGGESRSARVVIVR